MLDYDIPAWIGVFVIHAELDNREAIGRVKSHVFAFQHTENDFEVFLLGIVIAQIVRCVF